MTATLINGKQIAADIRNCLKEKIALLPHAPKLSVIIVGNNPASEIYIRNKERACTEVGIISDTIKLPDSTDKKTLLSLIDKLNQDISINGILVQLPLPAHLDEKEILQAISPQKDVDGFHPINSGLMLQKQKDAFIPCTPKGILRLIKSVKQDLSGMNAVIIGRSHIVGIPTANLLLHENCTITITHSKTQNLAAVCKNADILVAAIGKSEFITKDYIKPHAVIIDVGINRTQSGIKGDVNASDALELADYLTPVPGGVGPMTIAMLLENTYEAFLKQN